VYGTVSNVFDSGEYVYVYVKADDPDGAGLRVLLTPGDAFELAAKLMRYAAKADQDEHRCTCDDDTDYR
jgi:hypothetical protein